MLPVLQHACAGNFEHCNSDGLTSLLKKDNSNVMSVIAWQRAAVQWQRCDTHAARLSQFDQRG